MISCKKRAKYTFLLPFLFFFFVISSAFAQTPEQSQIGTAGVTPGAEAPASGAGGAADAAVIENGQTLFKNNCVQCHSVGSDVVVGPGLRDVHKRRSEAWLIKWIKNSSALIQSGDKDAVAVFNEYSKQQMPSFAFSDDELKSIIAYIKKESETPENVAGAPSAGPEGAEAGKNVGTDAIGNVGGYVDLLLVVLVVVLIVLVITLVIIATVLKNYLKGKGDLTGAEQEMLERRTNFANIYKSKAVRVIVGLIFVVVLVDLSIDKVMGIGIQQGYAPRQPIAFSHKLHAGDHQINCNYCHTSVYKSSSANIPSANICMNCHSQIKKESPEIQKIYRAIENNKPIEWVRVHNLPDLAYFNHSQHTKVGGVECQTCHGPIETMEVVAQYAPLTMGWCIDCHRNTPLNTEGNGYYDNLVKLHEKQSKGAFVVASQGGTECSKCHY
ncbi:c-type cytochrome [Rufibacter psychrotolerans]|uniref:c-type cytochrome n=1 Tax=Rufibacter psychrotolerans TaxID=2812556 RepID=UPI0019688864|nr:c-type cytochrome [Rufibacter sp. SYSU D00308]